jgi:hypothetical protein
MLIVKEMGSESLGKEFVGLLGTRSPHQANLFLTRAPKVFEA